MQKQPPKKAKIFSFELSNFDAGTYTFDTFEYVSVESDEFQPKPRFEPATSSCLKLILTSWKMADEDFSKDNVSNGSFGEGSEPTGNGMEAKKGVSDQGKPECIQSRP